MSFAGEFMIFQSNGDVMNARTATKLPVRAALSGSAAGRATRERPIQIQ
jgi:N-methylhydantoinase A/oxoprolinase/acetone carboxylase beta subunit